MAGSIYQSLSSRSSEIRLLTLLPSPAFSATIECILETTALDGDTKTYKAVSYAWGDPNKTILISVNGVDLYINKSLASALRYIRHATDPTVLWADAICINQDDDSEKNHQVQIMRKIYSGAELVIAWIGEPSHDSDLAMDIVANPPEGAVSEEADWSDSDTTSEEQDDDDDDVGNIEAKEGSSKELADDDDVKNQDGKEETDENKEDGHEDKTCEDVQELDDRTNKSDKETEIEDNGRIHPYASTDHLSTSSFSDVDGDGSSTDSDDSYVAFRPPAFVKNATIYSPEELQAVKSLLQRSWWGRLWVVQEVWLAKDLILKCGHKEVPRKMVQAWPELWLMGYGVPADGQYISELVHAATLITGPDREDDEELGKLTQLLRDFASRDTSMPQDRVYALLSLATDAEGYGPPDYTKRAEDIYTQVGIVSMKLLNSLEILHYAGTNNKAGCIDMDLPSWIPNWTRSFVYDIWQCFDASLSSEPKYETSEDSHTLIVEGLVYDTVSTSKPIAHVGLGEIPLWEEFLPQNKPQLYKTGVPHIQAILRTILLDTDMLPGNRIDINREDFFDVLTAFLCELGSNGKTPDPALEDISQEVSSSKYIDNFLEWIKESRDGRSDQEILSLFFDDDLLDAELYLRWIEGKDEDEISRFYSLYRTARNITVGTPGREIFQTDRGLLGNAQIGFKQGDLVCILLGCRVPVLLRQVESHYVLLGPCFVLGLMDGEAIHELNDQKFKLQKFAIS